MKKNNDDQEFEIVKQIVAGDTSRFKVLADAYKDKSLSLAYSILKNHDEAQDVLQDAFIRVFKNLHKFDFKSSFSTWLYRIVVNTCYTALKRNKNNFKNTFEKNDLNITSNEDSFDLTKSNERKDFINRVLNTLKPNEALVLRLFYLGEQNTNEIADITELSVSNVKVLLHRARTSFHSNIDQILGAEKKHLYE
ncbi:RNA polymerase sigma factor [Algoriphagus sp. D3-2-R+10]|uniref:RNA polymerase sigma factor n=1 Tax=Algoriphagus aurantiacus TaxID=3103948 RepID=UPI002B3D3368|nr:RNA polymerase sigma factor [Algoriphagus sp. D3-2-R+10]MEB2777349.1 RNA polymerase sigma factor [Algoriphagus sp. D3-2-R+10]